MGAEYETYLKSRHWRLIRWQKMMRAYVERTNSNRCPITIGLVQRAANNLSIPPAFIQECEDCKGLFPSKFMNVHHLTYERLGCELLSDLVILCESCHCARHGLHAPFWWRDAVTQGFDCERPPHVRSIGSLMAEVVASLLPEHEVAGVQ